MENYNNFVSKDTFNYLVCTQFRTDENMDAYETFPTACKQLLQFFCKSWLHVYRPKNPYT